MFYRKFLEKLYGIFGTGKYKLLLKNNNKNYYHEFNLAKQFLKKCGSEEIALLKIRAVYYKIISDDQFEQKSQEMEKLDISENKNFVQYGEPKMKEVIDYKTSYAIVQQAD
jgi:hypothetical protein